MKRIALAAATGLFLIHSAFALETLSLSNLKGSYEKDRGDFSAEIVDVNFDNMGVNLTDSLLSIEKSETQFILKQENITFKYGYEKDTFLDTVGLFQVEHLSVDLKKSQALKVDLRNIAVEIGDGVQSLPHLSLNCKKTSKFLAEFALPCLELGYLSIKEVLLDSKSTDTVTKALTSGDMGIAALDKLENIELAIMNGRYTLSLKTKFIFNIKVKATGSMRFDEKNQQLIIKLEKAKAGFFSVKKRLLKEIREADFKAVKVNGDVIVVSF